MQLQLKCYDNKMVKSPFNFVIFLLTQPQMANQKKYQWRLLTLVHRGHCRVRKVTMSGPF